MAHFACRCYRCSYHNLTTDYLKDTYKDNIDRADQIDKASAADNDKKKDFH